MSSERPPSITFKYKFSDSYNPTYANGVFGGITTKGEIAMNFFLERQALPYSETKDFQEDNTLSTESKFEPDDFRSSIIRFVETGVVFNHKNAVDFHKWLGGKIEELEQIEKANDGNDK